MISFRQFIKRRPITDDRRGDFVSDARRDRDLKNIRSLRGLLLYLRVRNACNGAIEAGRDLWWEFEAVRNAPHETDDEVLPAADDEEFAADTTSRTGAA